MLLSESAVDTLDRNSLIGLFEFVADEVFEPLVEEVSFSTTAKYFLASLVSPDLIEENRLVSALSSELLLLFEEFDVDDAEDAESSVKSEELLCIAEIDMACNPLLADFPKQRQQEMDAALRYVYGMQSSHQNLERALQKNVANSVLRK
jgi:hypothetical protein